MAKKIYLDNLELAQKGYVDSALQDKQDTLSPTAITDGTIDKVIGFDSQGNLKKAIPSTGSSNYNQLSNIPIVNQDLDDANFTPTTNTYYRHIGQDGTSYTIGAIYYYEGSEFHEITGSLAPSGDGVVVVELGGYVDADTMDSYLTITMEEFMKGIDNDVAFAKIGISNDDGATIQQYLYLAKVTGVYTEGDYGNLVFSSLFGASADSRLFGLNVQFEQTGSLNWDISLDFQIVSGSGTSTSVSTSPDFYTSQFAQKITIEGTDYNIKESFYTFTSPVASGDTLQQGEQTNAIEYFAPVIINGKKYIFQRQYTNGTSDDIIEYLGATIDNNQIKISMFEYNYTTKVITFIEKIVNSGVAYTTTVPIAPNTDGDLKFVVLTQAQATGITKYAGWLYYITD